MFDGQLAKLSDDVPVELVASVVTWPTGEDLGLTFAQRSSRSNFVQRERYHLGHIDIVAWLRPNSLFTCTGTLPMMELPRFGGQLSAWESSRFLHDTLVV